MRIMIATPFGAHQRGGIDRLVDLIVESAERDPEGNVTVTRLVTRGPGALARAPAVFAKAAAHLCLVASRGGVDLLHINVAAGGSLYRKAFLAMLARQCGIPYVVHVHGSRFDRFWDSIHSVRRRALTPLFEGSEKIIVLGRYWSDFIADRIPGVIGKILILPNATAPALGSNEPAADNKARISFLGEIGPRKGTPQLVQALGRLRDNPGWIATIAGNGQIAEMEKLSTELGISARVAFPGWLDAKGVNAVLARTDIFVLPSFAENLPMSILEAFSRGAAVIATPVGAVPDVVENERTGLLVPVGDVDALASAIRRLVEDPALRRKLGQAAQLDHKTHYDIGAYAARLKAVWQTAAWPDVSGVRAGTDSAIPTSNGGRNDRGAA